MERSASEAGGLSPGTSSTATLGLALPMRTSSGLVQQELLLLAELRRRVDLEAQQQPAGLLPGLRLLGRDPQKGQSEQGQRQGGPGDGQAAVHHPDFPLYSVLFSGSNT